MAGRAAEIRDESLCNVECAKDVGVEAAEVFFGVHGISSMPCGR
jgi:hypothetical protein